jgi:glycosyltransferase involved in cell wall biosynthesis
MKVLMTADTIGGVWTYALELAHALEPLGVEIVLATMGRRLDREQRRALLRASNVRLAESHYALEWMADPWRDVAEAGEWLRSIEDREQPDVVHLNGYAHGALDWRAPVMIVAHSCVVSWWRAVRDEAAPPEWSWYRDAVRRGLAGAELVVAPTQAILSAVREHHGPFGPVRVIANGVNSRRWRSNAKSPFILAAGRAWDEAKNFAALDRAATGLRWPVILAGEGRHPDGTLASFRSLRAIGHIAPSDLALLMGDAAIYALPARYEPFGLSALEAALSSCALVLGDLPSLREIWGDAALYVAPNDDRALHELLESLIADGARRAELGARARRRGEELGAAPMAERYLAAYRELAGGGLPASETRLRACAS